MREFLDMMNHHLPVNDNTSLYYDHMSYQMNQQEPLELGQQQQQQSMVTTSMQNDLHHQPAHNHHHHHYQTTNVLHDDLQSQQQAYQTEPNQLYEMYGAETYTSGYSQQVVAWQSDHHYLYTQQAHAEPLQAVHLMEQPQHQPQPQHQLQLQLHHNHHQQAVPDNSPLQCREMYANQHQHQLHHQQHDHQLVVRQQQREPQPPTSSFHPTGSYLDPNNQLQLRPQHHYHQQHSTFANDNALQSMPQDWLDNICRHLIDHLNRFGICVIDNFLGSTKGDLILEEVKQLYSTGDYIKGRVVNNEIVTSQSLGNGDVSVIRNDRVIWVEGVEEGCSEINNLIQTLCSVVTNSTRLSLYSNNGLDKIVINKRTKAHVACYPGNGTRYIKHVDNPNNDGRVITSIYYINKDWNTKRDGGLLRMFPAGMSEVANIEPLFDRVLFFWSDRRNPHEVLPAYKDRFAITVWYIGENRP